MTSHSHGDDQDWIELGKSSRPEITENIGFYEKKPDHHYRTEIPNFIFEILNGDALLVYCFLKRIAGDSGQCWMSIKNLAKKIGICESGLRRELNNLSIAGGHYKVPLINIIERHKADGSRDTNIIEIVDVWRENGDYFRKPKSCAPPIKNESTPPIKNATPPLSKMTGKEDLSQEDLKQQKKNVAASAAFDEFEKLSKELEKRGLRLSPMVLMNCIKKYGKSIWVRSLEIMKQETPNPNKDKSAIFTSICKDFSPCK